MKLSLTNIRHSIKIIRAEVLFIGLGLVLCLFGVLISLNKQLYLISSLASEPHVRSMVITLVGLGVPLILAGINLILKQKKLDIYLTSTGALLPIISLALFKYYPERIIWLSTLYILGIILLITVIFSNAVKTVSRATVQFTEEKAFLDINRSLNEKIKTADEVFARLFEIQSNLDLRNIKNMLSEYNSIVYRDREKIELVRDRLIIRLFEIADNCTAMIEAGKNSEEVSSILKQVHGVLEMVTGILPMEIKEGEDIFDPKKHENKDFDYREDLPENTIVEVFRNGYVGMSGETKRVAFVKVVKHKKR